MRLNVRNIGRARRSERREPIRGPLERQMPTLTPPPPPPLLSVIGGQYDVIGRLAMSNDVSALEGLGASGG